MTETPAPSDICLLLRAHCEQLWITTHLLPQLCELEPPRSIPEDELGSALAYLEVLWIDARQRAAETERAFDLLPPPASAEERPFEAEVRRYHRGVRRLRQATGLRVSRLISAPGVLPARAYAEL
jgi:hypothetical protein